MTHTYRSLAVAVALAIGGSAWAQPVSIVDDVSMGSAFIGHRKYTRVQGRRIEDGSWIGSFKARRNSMGGAFAGCKGACSVLGRAFKALGKDIAAWLQSPTAQARRGDM